MTRLHTFFKNVKLFHNMAEGHVNINKKQFLEMSQHKKANIIGKNNNG